MKVTIDRAGRVVIPKPVRSRLGLAAGTELELEVADGGLRLAPSRQVRIEVGPDGLPVLRAPEGTPPLTAEDVRTLTEETRSWPRS